MNMTHPHTHSSWQLWFEELSAPLTGGLICGEDLKYEETFKSLKASSSGVGEVDFKVMFIQATDLLQTQSKDLRLVSYLCLAATSEFGVVGLTYSIKLFNKILGDFAEQAHPIKARMRSAVNTWFLQQQDRLKGIAQEHTTSPEQWVELANALGNYNQQSVPLLDSESGPLSTLNEWNNEQIKRNPVAEPEIKAPPKVSDSVAQSTIEHISTTDKAATEQSTTRVSSNATINVADIANDTAYLAAVRELLNFDKEQNNIERVIKLSRAARWSGLKIPANDNGKTRLPAPRAAAFAPIENALANEQPDQALLLGEGLFMEGAMQFNLNLQLLILSALKQLNNAKLSHWLEQQLLNLTSQFPLLTSLQYDDGTGLCSPANKETLLELANEQNQQTNTVQANVFDDEYSLLADEVAQGQLSQALSKVEQLSTPTGFDQAQSQLLKAKLLLKAEHYDHALAILTELLAQIETFQLAKWQQHFCMEVWRFAKQCYANLSLAESDEMSLAAKQISQRMMVTNPAKAITWI
ncbi:hypothetical protein HH219_12525 [Pseudoalteromonas sp. NEC-BIFX-2020_015]|uniref:TssA family type VI secretion system protein n=1 Tax=Pseudoalteromonas sp. NEC-BIFX-2020_015 TaxID=2729544 RepID=UPI00146142A8|nr:TssA family type VI secretion system protein [Pseudoalteromonas sp. NEC-BIFX-2020_015]NMR26348.1 hypothetical protein [Pseudoalteromonas sp. NEC-BIFX-2020_015]